MSDITLYKLPDFQGDQISVSSHEVVAILTTSDGLMYQSARLNGNKLMASVWYSIFDPEDYEEYFFSEDINSFVESFITGRGPDLVNIVNLNADDIIVNMDIHQALRGFRGFIDCTTNLPSLSTRCFENYTTDRTLCTAAILDTNTLSADFSIRSTVGAQNVLAQFDGPYITPAICNVTYSVESEDIIVKFDSKDYINMTTEKIDGNHFIIHTNVSTPSGHCLMHSEEDYQGDNAVLCASPFK